VKTSGSVGKEQESWIIAQESQLRILQETVHRLRTSFQQLIRSATIGDPRDLLASAADDGSEGNGSTIESLSVQQINSSHQTQALQSQAAANNIVYGSQSLLTLVQNIKLSAILFDYETISRHTDAEIAKHREQHKKTLDDLRQVWNSLSDAKVGSTVSPFLPVPVERGDRSSQPSALSGCTSM